MARLNGRKVSRAELERAARIYHTSKDAAAALGVSVDYFAKTCKREGVETPSARKRRLGT